LLEIIQLPFLKKYSYKEFPINKLNDKLICNWLNIFEAFLKEHPEILITIADKGNITVALNKDNYISRMEEPPPRKFSRITIHTKKIDKHPTKKLICDLRSFYLLYGKVKTLLMITHIGSYTQLMIAFSKHMD